ncbi:MAG TPA: MarR family winged helix-turn-helix transcriptional regulator [Gaiellales bacterium]|jgi:DNA-binding MarR family transcriptional regulator
MAATQIAQVRRFNRTVTQRVGALDDGYLSRGRSLGQVRVLWEIGADGRRVRDLRAVLGLDSGHLSRLLRALEHDGLIRVEPDPDDARARIARLTPPGLAELGELDRRSDELVATILDPLSARQRDALVAAMGEVERLLTASLVRVAPIDPADPRARLCIDAYIAELGTRFDDGFDPARSISAERDELSPPAGILLMATLHDEPVGCAALKHRGDGLAEVKRMWVSPAVRGLGLGRRLLSDLESHARAHGTRTLRLETNRSLGEAIALYRATGYREVAAFSDEPYAHHWFEKTLG